MSERAAGRELDAEIAERVMGYRPVTVLSGTDAEHIKYVAPDRPLTTWNAVEPAPYSTDIAAAWLVVEKLTASGQYFTMDLFLMPSRKWIAHFDFEEDSVGDSAPHAICLAALAWVSSSSGQGAE